MDEFAPKNELVEVLRWPINIQITEARGAAFAAGHLFIADFGNPASDGGLISVDLASGDASRVTAKSSGAPVMLRRPADVKIGPDGAISVLNNDPSANGVVRLAPDGTVLSVLPLPGKTLASSGLAFAPDGTIYISDFAAGNIQHYAPNGARLPLQSSAGGLNNPGAVWLDEQGRFYAPISGERRFFQYTAGGGRPQAFALKCDPYYAADNGRWLDVACAQKAMVSIDVESGRVARSRIIGQEPRPGWVRGIAYDPNGILYLVDNERLIGYRITHPW